MNYIDLSFQSLIDYIKDKNYDELHRIIKQNFNFRKNSNPAFKNIIDYYNKYKLWGEVDLENDLIEPVDNNASTLLNHYKDFLWFYNLLSDYRSKKILNNVLYYWLMFDEKMIGELIDKNYQQYYDLDIVKCDKNEIIVDVGAYVGDSVITYNKVYGNNNYKKIYCYEIVKANIDLIRENVKAFKLKNIVIKEKGLADKNGSMFITEDNVSSTSQLSTKGEKKVEITTLDNDIKGPVTFIKMDIEGSEFNALLGMKEKISKYKPKLAISLYHNNDHLWKIPKFIHELNPNYNFYLRYYGGNIFPTEYILYAV